MAVTERHHWLNTFVGILDGAFHLTDVEQARTLAVFRDLLIALRIPERGEPTDLPAPVAMEVTSNFFTIAMAGPRDTGYERPVREVSGHDLVVSLEVWRDALSGMLIVAYPDLQPAERLLAAKVFADVLASLGVPRRAAEFLPDDVVRTHLAQPNMGVW